MKIKFEGDIVSDETVIELVLHPEANRTPKSKGVVNLFIRNIDLQDRTETSTVFHFERESLSDFIGALLHLQSKLKSLNK
jgi:hypothetical protein